MLLRIEVMKTEVMTHQTLADSIKTLVVQVVDRKNGNGKDIFDMSNWWKANCAKLPVFT
jgi:hypothetical protein